MWKNDPAIGAIPAVGEGTVDIGRRTLVGEAARYDGSNPVALIDFIGDATLTVFDNTLYRRSDSGHLSPLPLLSGGGEVVVVRPPAGDWFVVTADQLMQEFAIVVHVPDQLAAPEELIVEPDASIGTAPVPAGASTYTHPGTGFVTHVTSVETSPETPKPKPVKKAAPRKAAAKKAPAKKAAPKK